MGSKKFQLYTRFHNSGFSIILVGVFGIKWVVGAIGVVLNGALVYVTLRNRSIQNACNYLIAINALFNLLYQTNHAIPFVISLIGANFVKLPICFYLQLYGIFAIHSNLGISLSIGVDRLLSVLFPTWRIKRDILYVSVIFGVCSFYGAYILFLCFQVATQLSDLPVLCSASDCYQGDLSFIISRNASIFVMLNIICYAVVWILLIYAAFKRSTAKDTLNHKIYKSLTVIMFSEIFGYLSNYVTRLFVLPRLQLKPLDGFYVSSVLSMATNLAMASNTIILYTFSTEYRRVFHLQFPVIFRRRSEQVQSLVSMAPTPTRSSQAGHGGAVFRHRK